MDDQSATCAFEKIDAVRICLMGQQHTMAVLGEFRSADRVLAAWAGQATRTISIDFRVTFFDGFVLCGSYQYRRQSRRKPSLSTFVRATLAAAPGLARYGIDC